MLSPALQSVLDGRFAADLQAFARHSAAPVEALRTGIPALDELTGGFPRGAVTEISGPACSGRTSLLFSMLAQAGREREVCALVDTEDAFDPESAAAAGVALDRLLWIRCGGNAEHALRAVDLVVQGGGFGVVVWDLADTPPRTARRIAIASWYRLRHAVEHTRTVMVVVGEEPYARQCASLALESRREGIVWSGAPGCSRLLRGIRLGVERRKPVAQALVPATPRLVSALASFRER